MKKNTTLRLFVLGLLALLIAPFCFAQEASVPMQEQYSRLKIYTNDGGLLELGALGVEIDHGNYKKGVWFESDFSASDIQKIEAAGFTYDVVHKDVVDYYMSEDRPHSHSHFPHKAAGCASSTTDGEVGEYPVPEDFELGDMGGYFTYAEMLDHLDNMAEKYPNLISVKDTIKGFKTHDNNVLHWVKISDSPNVDEEEPEVLYTALHHSREPMSLSQMIYYMYYLLENYETDEKIQFLVDNTEMYFIPCINPDGYLYNQLIRPNGGGMWRRNTHDNDGDGAFSPQTDGVDLNRNYDWEWGLDDLGSSPDPTSDVYRGESPASEPEIKAVQSFCERHNFQIALNYHAFSDLVIYPWGFVADSYTPDSALFVNYAQILTQENGYTYGTANQTVGYLVNGDSDDWMYGEQTSKNKIFAFTPEVGGSEDGFWPSSSRIIPLCQENMAANISTASLVHNFGRVRDTSPLYVNELESNLSFELTRIGLENDVPFTVSIEAKNDAVLSVGSPQDYTIDNPMEFVEGMFTYELRDDLESGAAIEFDLILDNHQGNVERIAVVKYFGEPVIGLEENADNLQAWSGNEWGISLEEYVSSSSSITDSPDGNYGPDIYNQITLNEPIDLTETQAATLSFWAKWDIEANYDYVQIHVIDSETNIETPLCGKYTTMGNSYLDDDQPLYDGVQSNWVKEEISLNDFIGRKITIRFSIWSDSFVDGDGFYFDDLRVEQLGTSIGTSIADVSLNPSISLSQNTPNPVVEVTNFAFESHKNIPSMDLVIYNALGQEAGRQTVSTQQDNISVDMSSLKNGIYFCRLESAQGNSKSVRVTVMR